ncbi:MAG: XkdX family protein [Sarcina sp.]
MDFNTWKQFYEWGFATKEQLMEAVKENMITPIQYKEITGDVYNAKPSNLREFF